MVENITCHEWEAQTAPKRRKSEVHIAPPDPRAENLRNEYEEGLEEYYGAYNKIFMGNKNQIRKNGEKMNIY